MPGKQLVNKRAKRNLYTMLCRQKKVEFIALAKNLVENLN
jgi:hypothetical protein